MEIPKVQWGNTEAIRARTLRGFALLAIGIMVLLAIPIALALDVVGSAESGLMSGGVVGFMVVGVVLGLLAGWYGFRSGYAIRRMYWLDLKPTGIELWRGSSRQPVDVLPWTSLAAVQAAADPPALWLRREPRAAPTPGTDLSAVGGQFPATAGATGDWDLGIALDPASGDPRNLEQEIAARIRAPR